MRKSGLRSLSAIARKFKDNHSFVDSSAKVHESVTIGPFSVLLENVEVRFNVLLLKTFVCWRILQIQEGVSIGSCCVVGPDVVIGEFSRLASNITMSNCTIGSRVNILPGARIGQVERKRCPFMMWSLPLRYWRLRHRMDLDFCHLRIRVHQSWKSLSCLEFTSMMTSKSGPTVRLTGEVGVTL
jgi:hypothetical protein